MKNSSNQLEAELLVSRSRTLTVELWGSEFGPVLMLRSDNLDDYSLSPHP
jgi:hypothetical protein